MTVLRHILSILLLPFVVTVVVPCRILASRPAGFAAWPEANPPGIAAALLGAAGIGCGLALVVWTNWQFAAIGRGTLAPWDPPKHFVVTGVYRHVRNPMISGVLLILFGEASLFRSRSVLEWALVFLVINLIYIPLLEEHDLEQRFGDEYRRYKQNVPRWVPRWTAWTPQGRT